MALAGDRDLFPAFALGMLLMQIFSVELGWLPTVGADTPKHYILPSMTLGRGRLRGDGRASPARRSLTC